MVLSLTFNADASFCTFDTGPLTIGATATGTVAGGRVAAVTVTGGANETSAPTLTFGTAGPPSTAA